MPGHMYGACSLSSVHSLLIHFLLLHSLLYSLIVQSVIMSSILSSSTLFFSILVFYILSSSILSPYTFTFLSFSPLLSMDPCMESVMRLWLIDQEKPPHSSHPQVA